MYKAIILKNANLWEAWVNDEVVFSNPSCEQVCDWAEAQGFTLDIVPATPQMAMA